MASALKQLQELDYAGRLVIETEESKIADCRGLLCRPTSGGRITKDFLASAPRPFVIGTLSVGVDHIDKELRDDPAIRVINADGGDGDVSARAVAEQTVALANMLLRRTHRAASSVEDGIFSNALFLDGRRLEGTTWVCVGSGRQTKAICPLLWACRVSEIIILNPALNVRKFHDCLDSSLPKIVDLDVNSFKLQLNSPGGGTMRITGMVDSVSALKQADILSLHLPGREENRGYLNPKTLNNLKRTCMIVNCARGNLVDEGAVVEALRNGKIGGYAADVLSSPAETEKDPRFSPLWSACMTKEPLNIVITPHIGGCTVDCIEALSNSVIPRLLTDIGISA